MSDQTPSDVLGGLPRTRPHRRSDKRPSKPAASTTATATGPAVAATASKAATAPKAAAASKPKPKPKPSPRSTTTASKPKPKLRAVPPPSRVAAQKATKPAPTQRTDILGTAVQAAAELTEIGLSATARALRGAVSRLPRP